MAWLIGGGVVAVVVALVVLGTVIKDDEPSTATPTAVVPTWVTRPDATTVKTPPPATPVPTAPATASTTWSRTATATPSPDFPAGLHPRCIPAPAADVAKVQAKLKDPTHRVVHAVILTGGEYRYLAASVVRADNVLVQKSDVWTHTVSRGWTSTTGGARGTTSLPKTSDVVTDVDPGGEEVQTADRCAYDWAKISGYN